MGVFDFTLIDKTRVNFSCMCIVKLVLICIDMEQIIVQILLRSKQMTITKIL